MEKIVKQKHRGGVYEINYHFVWCPKYRRPVLVGGIADDAKVIIENLSKSLGCEIKALEVMPDHVHLFISALPKLSPQKLVKRFKGATSNALRKKYPQLLKIASLWSSSYYIGTVGHVSDVTVQLYIANQKGV